MNDTIKKVDWKRWVGNNSVIIAVVALLIVATAMEGTTFFSFNNIINILRNNSIVGIIALGMTVIIITGGIDLSVGAQLAFQGIIIVSVFNATQNVWLSVIVGIMVAILLGLGTGVLVSKFTIPAFIVTLGTMYIFRSLSQYWMNGGGLMSKGENNDAFLAISGVKLFGVIPMPIIIWFVCAFVVFIIMQHTAVGRHIYAVGSNEKATTLASINPTKVRCFAYMMGSILVTIAAVVECSRLGSINSASSGTSYEMDAIAAAVIGGTSMAGGKGKIWFTVLGTLTLGIINNLMNLAGVNAFLVGAVKGAIIIAAVLLQKVLNQNTFNN